MTCRELNDFLADYLAGDLVAEERSAFEAHLADCVACIDYVRGYRETVRLARGSAPDADATMPEALVDAILAATGRRR